MLFIIQSLILFLLLWFLHKRNVSIDYFLEEIDFNLRVNIYYINKKLNNPLYAIGVYLISTIIFIILFNIFKWNMIFSTLIPFILMISIIMYLLKKNKNNIGQQEEIIENYDSAFITILITHAFLTLIVFYNDSGLKNSNLDSRTIIFNFLYVIVFCASLFLNKIKEQIFNKKNEYQEKEIKYLREKLQSEKEEKEGMKLLLVDVLNRIEQLEDKDKNGL